MLKGRNFNYFLCFLFVGAVLIGGYFLLTNNSNPKVPTTTQPPPKGAKPEIIYINNCEPTTAETPNPSKNNGIPQIATKSDSDKEAEYENWKANFKPANPKYQTFCERFLNNYSLDGLGKGSQFGQDGFLFFNYFKYWPMEGKKGFYVDSGAHHYELISNTLFYDVCLGWEGLCVEPDGQFIDDLKKHRSCIVNHNCISDKDDVQANIAGMKIHEMNRKSRSENGDEGIVTCHTLKKLLKDAGKENVPIDLWSLDVEGYELKILKMVNFSEIEIRSIFMEDFWIPSREANFLLSMAGFDLSFQLPIDAYYIQRFGSIKPLSKNFWFEHKHQKTWDEHIIFRKQNKGTLCENSITSG